MVEIFDDNYAEAFALECYYIEQAKNQNRILNFVNECICLETGDYSAIAAINESAVDNIKKFFTRILEFFKKVFAKFKERINELFTTDKVFIKKYRDTILKRDFKRHPLTDMWDYNVSNVAAITSVRIDYNNGNDIRTITDERDYTEEDFVKKYLDSFDKTKKLTEVADVVNFAIKGEETRDDIYLSDLNKDEMLKFCEGFEATVNKIEKNQSEINAMSSKIINEVSRRQKIATDRANTSTQESSVYSNVYGRYISEFGAGKVEGEDKGSNSSSGGPSTKGSVAGGQGLKADSDQAKKDTEDYANKDTNGMDLNNEQKKLEREVAGTEVFFKCAVAVQTNTMTAVTAMYKDYMKLLRIHVRDYVATEEDKTVANNGDTGASEQKTEEPQKKEKFKDKVVRKFAGTKNPNEQK